MHDLLMIDRPKLDSTEPDGYEFDWAQDAVRLADLFSQAMSKTLSRRLLLEVPEAREAEITVPQIQALRYLWLHEQVLMGDLAEGLDISHPSATNMVKRLADKGMIHRISNPDDRRQIVVALTQAGLSLTRSVERARIARLSSVLERMGEPVRSAFLRGIKRFLVLAIDEDPCTAADICLRCGTRASTSCPLAEIIPLFVCK